VSKQGLPINIQHFGKIDLRKVYQNVDQKRHWEAVRRVASPVAVV
jgi:hypothetical protein